MKKILLAAICLSVLLVTACSKNQDQVLVRFQNNSSQDITNAEYVFLEEDRHTWLGLLPAGETTSYVSFDYFEVGDDLPMGHISAKVAGNNVMASSFMFCGTGVDFHQLEPGKYTLEISNRTADGPRFYLLKFAE